MRVGELVSLLIEDVDFDDQVFHIRSKPEMFWRVKTARRRVLPLTDESKALFEQLISDRKFGFIFLNLEHYEGRLKPAKQFGSDVAYKRYLVEVAENEETEKHKRRAVITVCRKKGQIPVKRIQSEFCKLTTKIGCQEFTRTHDLRHLFSSRAQERGANPILVQEMLGHATLDMTRRYTHLGVDAKRELLGILGQIRSENNKDSIQK